LFRVSYFLSDAQDVADIVLEAEAMLGEWIANIPDKEASSARGTRSLPEGVTKKESHFAQEIHRFHFQPFMDRKNSLWTRKTLLGS